ncbi:hypothetical protein FACS189468_6860 [Spirochaetia bacterium]|nr:hypothetical protein FACS189468_6860 [Spirochaetia bacterium]
MIRGVADEIRNLVEIGSPQSLTAALELIRSRNVGNSDFGRMMNAVTAVLFQKIYPDVSVRYAPPDPPQTHAYTRILREAERGKYTPPFSNSRDYLEYVLPFLAFLSESRDSRLLSALPDLERARALNPDSVLAPLFLGLVYEGSGRLDEADAAFAEAQALSGDCYPAELGRGRIMGERGQVREAIELLSDMVVRYPDNLGIKRQLALVYYNSGDLTRAAPLIAAILRRNTRDGELILLRARILIEQGQVLQAQTPLDTYASIDPHNRLYLFLRARVQAEGYRNWEAALNYLRSLLRAYPLDTEASLYAASLLLESPNAEEQIEGRALLTRLLNTDQPSLEAVSLAVQDAIRREAWREGRSWVERLLTERRSSQDLLNAYTIERGLGNNTAALSYIRERYDRDPSDEAGISAYISALLDTGRMDEARRLLESRLAAVPGGVQKSEYYFLRSRLGRNEEGVMTDLRSSLFENPRNLKALIAMFEIYHRRKDERRAVFYLKQALALAPTDPLLRRYEVEYSAALGSGY